MEKYDFSERLTELRLFLGLNQTQFARKLDIPRTTIIGYESGNSIPSDFLMRLHKTFGLNIKWFLFGEGVPVILKIPTAQEITNDVIRNITEKNRKNLKEDKPTSRLNRSTNVAQVAESKITDYASAIEELLKPLIIEIHGQEIPLSQKVLDLIEELSKALAEPTDKNAPKLDEKTENRLDELIIEMANMKRNMQILMQKIADNEEKNS